MSTTLAKNWPLVELGQVSTSRLGKMLSPVSKQGADELPYLGNADVQWGALTLGGLRTMSFSPDEQRKFALSEGDVLICEGGEAGRTAVVERDLPGIYFQKAIHRVRCSEDLDPQYLFRFMQFAALSGRLDDFSSQATIKHLTGVKLRQVPIPLPPIEEQRRIAAALDAADALRAKRRQAIAKLDSLTQAIFIDMFGDALEPPTALEQVAEIQGGIQVTSKRKSKPLEVPYLRVANVHRGSLDLSEIKTIRVTERELDRTRLVKGDLLVVEGHGNKDEIGRVGIWDGSVSECVHQNHLIRVRCNRDLAHPRYVETFMNSRVGRRALLRAANTTSGLNTISTSDVRNVQLPVPALCEQTEFVARTEFVDRAKTDQTAGEAGLDALFVSLQQRAYRGEL